jgi:TonB family protein
LTTKYLADLTALIATLKWDRNLAAGTHDGPLFSLTWRENSDNFYVAASGGSLDSLKRPEAGEGDGSSELAQRVSKNALDKTFSTSIKMSPDDARKAKGNLRALVICRLAETPIDQDKGFKNTVVVIPVAIWFYDLPSGKVYAKLPHGSPRPATPTAGGVGVSGNNEEFGPPAPRPAPKYEANKVYKPSEVSSKARILSRRDPSYTEEARSLKVSGTVVLRAIFRSDGSVTDIRIVSGLPHGLTERAIEAAKMIKFAPATVEGRPVSQYIQIEYNFNPD